METQNQEKSCQNCRYYIRYYYKCVTKYLSVHCGHCIYKNAAYRIKEPSDFCDNFLDAREKKETQRRTVKEALVAMSARLDELTQILKDDSVDEPSPLLTKKLLP